MLAVGDVVRVSRIPHTLLDHPGIVLGAIGVAEELKGRPPRAFVQGLTPNGRPTSAIAWLPTACLHVVTDPAWRAAVDEYRRWFSGVVAEQVDRRRRWQRQLERVGARYDLSVEQVLEIADAVYVAPAECHDDLRGH